MQQPRGACEQPEVEVGGSVAPAVDVDAGDAVQAEHRTFGPLEEGAEFGRSLGGQVTQVVVAARLEHHDRREPGLGADRVQPPVVVGPEGFRHRLEACTALVGAVLALTGGFGEDGWVQGLDPQVTLEGERLPVGHRVGGQGQPFTRRQASYEGAGILRR